jgi:saccharopine dehydrogenase-like NADP-dependent oxidoreductase
VQAACLGGAGRIAPEAALDLVQFSPFERIVIADRDEAAGREVVEWLADPRVEWLAVDLADRNAAVAALAGFDVVLDGTPTSVNGVSTEVIARAGCHAINLNGFGEEERSDAIFRAADRTCVPGFGMTPGTTNMMARHAAERMESVESVRISHGAFRPIAFSRAIVETTAYEYDPNLPGLVVYEGGRMVHVPPFARPLVVQLSEPYGALEEYIIPHSETVTLADFLADKGVQLIEVRGTWPPANMRLLKSLHEWAILANPRVTLVGQSFGLMDALAEYLATSQVGRMTDLYGYALHVEVVGRRDGRRVRQVMTQTHPPSDGSVPDWAGLRAYTRCVGIPFAIGAQFLAAGRVAATGCVTPERAFDPAEIFAELDRRQIKIHEQLDVLDD